MSHTKKSYFVHGHIEIQGFFVQNDSFLSHVFPVLFKRLSLNFILFVSHLYSFSYWLLPHLCLKDCSSQCYKVFLRKRFPQISGNVRKTHSHFVLNCSNPDLLITCNQSKIEHVIKKKEVYSMVIYKFCNSIFSYMYA